MCKKNVFVEAVGVHVKAAGTDIPLLTDVRFAVRDGEWVAVIGKSGSGKSTLAKTLAGVIQPDAGYVTRRGRQNGSSAAGTGGEAVKAEGDRDSEIAESAEGVGDAACAGTGGESVKSEEVSGAEKAERAEGARAGSTAGDAENVRIAQDAQHPVQLVMQNPEAQTIGETVFEDVCFGLENRGIAPEDMAVMAEEALAKTGLAGYAGRMTKELSGGQKQLLAIAGALAAGSSVIVFDEATSMLDPASRERILGVVKELHRQGTAVVWITQLLDELAFADRVVVMDGGKAVFDGEPRQFFYDASFPVVDADGDRVEHETCCDRYGFVRPFAVETARLLIGKGFTLPKLPLTPEELAEAVAEASFAEGGVL
ncbi:ATP-binding cassette domain-containing protein [Paenibacillus contaminans]|nr:ATP-binding cassette domain-containing protein [Paenibacillus contaminans]